MNFRFIILTLISFAIGDLFAREFLYLRNVPSCRIEAFKDGKLTPVPGEGLMNLPLDLNQFTRHPTYVKFELNSQLYVASTACVFLESGENFLDGSFENQEDPGPLKLFSMFTLSQGNFDEKLPDGAGEVKSQQNSPMTFGLAGNYPLNKNGRMLTASFYSSFLKTSKVTNDAGGSAQSGPIPNEIGANIYHQNLIKDYNFSLYEGFDYEKFSTFNSREYIQDGSPLSVNSNVIYLATIGVSKPFYFGSYTLTTKFSMATIFSSSTSSANSGDTFKGERFLFFASLRGTDKFSYNFLYKRHNLTGPSTLTTDRFGIGLSYELF